MFKNNNYNTLNMVVNWFNSKYFVGNVQTKRDALFRNSNLFKFKIVLFYLNTKSMSPIISIMVSSYLFISLDSWLYIDAAKSKCFAYVYS